MIADALVVAGCALLVAGVLMLSIEAGVIVAGLLMIGVGLLTVGGEEEREK